MMPRLLLLICALISSSTLLADDNDRQYNLVRLQAQQSESVSNDTMHVTLNTYAEMKNASKLAARINGDMEWALALAKQDPAIKVRTGGYQTWPVTRKDVTSTWRGSQDLILESLDTERLSELTGKLQAKLQVKSMNFTVSDEKRRGVENRLIDAALDAYKARADIVASNLSAKGYRIVDINVSAAGQRPPVMYQARVATLAMDSSEAVATESGESDVQVTVSGTVELRMP